MLAVRRPVCCLVWQEISFNRGYLRSTLSSVVGVNENPPKLDLRGRTFAGNCYESDCRK